MRIGGIIGLAVNGEIHNAKGDFTYNTGAPKRTPVIGAEAVHGYTEEPQVPFIEGEITDRSDLNLSDITNMKDATVTLALANGKTFVLSEAWYAGDGNARSKEGNITFRFEGLRGEEV